VIAQIESTIQPSSQKSGTVGEFAVHDDHRLIDESSGRNAFSHQDP